MAEKVDGEMNEIGLRVRIKVSNDRRPLNIYETRRTHTNM